MTLKRAPEAITTPFYIKDCICAGWFCVVFFLYEVSAPWKPEWDTVPLWDTYYCLDQNYLTD